MAVSMLLSATGAEAVGNVGMRVGRTNNAYKDQFSDSDMFAEVDSKVEFSQKPAKNSQIYYAAGLTHRQYISETKANTSRLFLDGEYITLLSKDAEFSQRVYYLYNDAPNFLRQRLGSHTLYLAPKLRRQLAKSDLNLMLPIQGKLFAQETNGRAGPGDIFEEPYKEDHYTVGLDASWRRFLGKGFRRSFALGLAADARFFRDKPATRTDGSIFDSDDPRSGNKSRDILTRLKMSYRASSRRYLIEPQSEWGYNYDLNHGSEDYLSLLMRLILEFKLRVLKFTNKTTFDQKNYQEKRSDITNPADSPRLVLRNLINDFGSFYKLNQRFQTGGGFRYQKFDSNFQPDSFQATEFYALVDFNF